MLAFCRSETLTVKRSSPDVRQFAKGQANLDKGSGCIIACECLHRRPGSAAIVEGRKVMYVR